jgi:hypothetical protein
MTKVAVAPTAVAVASAMTVIIVIDFDIVAMTPAVTIVPMMPVASTEMAMTAEPAAVTKPSTMAASEPAR